MPAQNFELNLKGRDAGWEGKQVESYSCAECGALGSDPGKHSGWHDGLTNRLNQIDQAIQQLNQAINQVAQSVQQEAQTRQQVDNNLQAQINTKT